MAIKIHVNESTDTGLTKDLSDGLVRLVGMLQDEFPLVKKDDEEYGIAISGDDAKIIPVNDSGYYDLSKEKVEEVVGDVYARNLGEDILNSDVTYTVRFEVCPDKDEFFARVKVFAGEGYEDTLGLSRIRYYGDGVDSAIHTVFNRIREDLEERISSKG